jgi:hypothetical protein
MADNESHASMQIFTSSFLMGGMIRATEKIYQNGRIADGGSFSLCQIAIPEWVIKS